MRYETIIRGPAPDDEDCRAEVTIGSRKEKEAFAAKLRELLGADVTVTTKWIKEVERKPKPAIPGNPGGQILADVPHVATEYVPGSPHRVRTAARDGEAA